jgi:uncharacterized membrane protein
MTTTTDISFPARRLPPRTGLVAYAVSRPWPCVVWTAIVGWSALLLAMVYSHYHEFRLGRFDLGNMVQAVWSTADGRPLETTFQNGDQVERLASHVDPFLVLLTPLWVVFPSPVTLAAAQIVACALGALPVFWLARRHLASEDQAAFLALAYLAYPWIAWSALEAIHPVTFAIPLFLFGIWFLDSDRLHAFSACAVLAALTGELMGLPLVCLGLWYWLARGQRRPGIVIAALGATWTLVALKVIVPAFRGEESPFYVLFEHVGGSLEGVLGTAVTDPLVILEAMATGRDALYVLALAAPLALFFLRAPALALAATPILAVNLMSSMGAHTNPADHSIAGIVPFLFAATVFGVARIRPHDRRRATSILALTVVASSLVMGPWFRSPPVPTPGGWTEEHIQALRVAVALVPEDAPVVATNNVGSHLAARRYVYSVPTTGAAEWAVVDRLDNWVPIHPRRTSPPTWGRFDRPYVDEFTARLEQSGEWSKVFDRSDVLVYRRMTGGPPAQTETAPRRKSTISPVVAPGPKTAATPAAFNSSASSGGIVPPTTTRTSSAPFSLSPSTILGTSVMCAPERIETPTASASSWIAVSTICSGV